MVTFAAVTQQRAVCRGDDHDRHMMQAKTARGIVSRSRNSLLAEVIASSYSTTLIMTTTTTPPATVAITTTRIRLVVGRQSVHTDRRGERAISSLIESDRHDTRITFSGDQI
jgi:hypothetical protein